HLKSEHRMGRNYLWHRAGDAANAVLAAAGYNFRRLIKWLSLLLFEIFSSKALLPEIAALIFAAITPLTSPPLHTLALATS
ncbi:MAG: hypothetical protein P4M07_07525, partial [Xanthobacteraceae bacterium]|nr:hypothetical protein [Xanthobacteraceae bacterium]